ncbi:DNA/RNA nuclease SfsA [Maritimibacter sp. DP1N21-5]|uniref:DNA/RNA nuclease SfsA n=1 Tax=Maritimibacter sp. DP1N21-5 TaxID=2836867 RepID=UPI001C4791DA|nr:DNA/RNA nuclease SfsA [Maritimibacter sp. DP1N21-5]MBV7408397.1 DNA/RNA nuclease SfsA [Maritimibacter sp. DP1N21-5]
MDFATPLIPATLLRRYKRFLADCRLEDGTEITAHCANPGSMMGLADPGLRIWLEPNDDPKKKLKFGWRLVEHADGSFTGVDTALPNRMLKQAFMAGIVPDLAGYTTVRPEVAYGDRSRVDFLLTGDALPQAWVEVKSVTLARVPGRAEFPDSVTARGTRHMEDLAKMARAGDRAVIFYLVQRSDATEVRIAADIDPTYARAVEVAVAAGVEPVAYGTRISPTGVTLGERLPVIL